jgi:3-oxoacyl-[acyl-carrier protein] reductase
VHRFEGQVAVVTGAAQGIGAAIAARLGAEGGAIAVLDINEAAAQDQVDRLEAVGIKGLAVGCDVADSASVEQAIAATVDRWGRLDVLVTNAGITRDNLLFRMTEDEWDSVVDVHLKGTFLCARAAQRHMVDRGYGRIVAISSRSALGNRGQANYSSAKAGILGFVRTAAIELGPKGITVNAVAPGHIETAMTHAIADQTGTTYDDVKAQAIALNAIKRVGQPDDIAAAVAFFASEEGGYVTGQVLYCAGRPVS